MLYGKKTPDSRRSVVSGVLFLTLSGVAVKIIGLLFKIPLSRILGDEGMGYFNCAFTIYAWLYMICTAGVPVAVSVLVAKKLAENKKSESAEVAKTATRLFFFIGLGGTLLLMLFSVPLARAVGSSEASYAIIAISPSLLFVCVGAVMRGYFQGCSNMMPTAVSQLIEALCKLIPGIGLALYAVKRGYSLPAVAAFSILGVTLGSLLSMIYLLLFSRKETEHAEKDMTKTGETEGQTVSRLFKIMIPVTLSASVMSLTNIADLSLIMRRLISIGYTESQATALFGNYTTLVVPMFNLPSIFVYPIAYALVPAVSYAHAKGSREEISDISDMALRFVSVISLPCAMAMGIFSFPILSSVFSLSSSTLAAPYLSVISPSVFFICVVAITNSLLQATGQQNKPIWSMCAGAAVKILSGYFLIGDRHFGLMGAPIGTLLCYATVTVMNFVFLKKTVLKPPSVARFLLFPLLSSVISVGGAAVLYGYLPVGIPGIIRLLICAFPALIVYCALIFLLKVLDMRDISQIPSLNKLMIKLQRKVKKHDVS